jgi:MYXO-CTERM domain-containing protein
VVSTLPNTSSGGTSSGWLTLLTLPAGVVVARALRRRRAAGCQATLRWE